MKDLVEQLSRSINREDLVFALPKALDIMKRKSATIEILESNTLQSLSDELFSV